jgi:hypothetical protein
VSAYVVTKEESRVLTKAILRVAEQLELPQSELSKILGVSSSTVSRLNDERQITSGSKEAELAVLMIRLYRSLDAILGGNVNATKDWFYAQNTHLGNTPAILVQKVEGLVHVVEYLDAMRGKL